MKVLLTLLAGLIGAILSAAALTLLSDYKIAIQIGGENNTIEQKTESRPSDPNPTQTGQPISQLPSSPTTQSSTTTTQPQVTVTINDSQPSVPAPAPVQVRRPVNRPHYTETAQYEDECACPVEESVDEEEDEVSAEGTYEEVEEVEECDCEEEPPAT